MPELSPANLPGSWVPYIALVVALLAPLGPVLLTNRNARKAKEAATATAAKLEASSARTAQKLDIIHRLVDGQLSAARRKIDILEQRLLEAGEQLPPESPHITPPDIGPYPEGPAPS